MRLLFSKLVFNRIVVLGKIKCKKIKGVFIFICSVKPALLQKQKGKTHQKKPLTDCDWRGAIKMSGRIGYLHELRSRIVRFRVLLAESIRLQDVDRCGR